MLAAAGGKQVQYMAKHHLRDVWIDADDPSWDWRENDYRIKPEPRTWWLGFDTHGRTSVFYFEPAAGCLQPGEQLIKVREVIP